MLTPNNNPSDSKILPSKVSRRATGPYNPNYAGNFRSKTNSCLGLGWETSLGLLHKCRNVLAEIDFVSKTSKLDQKCDFKLRRNFLLQNYFSDSGSDDVSQRTRKMLERTYLNAFDVTIFSTNNNRAHALLPRDKNLILGKTYYYHFVLQSIFTVNMTLPFGNMTPWFQEIRCSRFTY